MTSVAEVHDWLRGVDPGPMSRPELSDLIAELEQLRCRLDERLLAAKASVDALADTGADGASVGRAVGRRSMRQAKSDQRVAKTLAEMPLLAGALADGRVNVEHAAIIARAVDSIDTAKAAELVPVAESMPADLFARKAREFVGRHTTAQQAADRAKRQHDQRAGWHTIKRDGSIEIHARFDKAVGEQVLAAWKRQTDRLWRDDGGRDGTPDEVRSATQRRADALAGLLTAEHTPNTATHPKYQVHIVWNLGERSITWLDGDPVPTSVIDRIGPAADVIGHLFSDHGQPLWIGRTKRLATVAQWRALIVATRGCEVCGADIDRCQAHHLEEWLQGGPTDIDNLGLRCHTCHANEHRAGHTDSASHRRRRRTGPYRAASTTDDHITAA